MTFALERFYREHRRLLLVLLAILAGNVVLLLAQKPLWVWTAHLRGAVAESEKARKDALRSYGQEALGARLMENAQGRVSDLFEHTFQTERDRYPTVDAKIKEIAARFRLSPHSINYSWSQRDREGLIGLGISFNLKGSYDNLRRFVGEIEAARDEEERDLFFAIERITLNDSTDSGLELNLTITVNTYFHRPELREAWELKRTRKSPPARSGGRS